MLQSNLLPPSLRQSKKMENYLEDGRNKLLRNVGTNLHGVQRNEIFKKANGMNVKSWF